MTRLTREDLQLLETGVRPFGLVYTPSPTMMMKFGQSSRGQRNEHSDSEEKIAEIYVADARAPKPRGTRTGTDSD